MHLLHDLLKKSKPFDLGSSYDGVNYAVCIIDTSETVIYQNREHLKWFGDSKYKKCKDIYVTDEDNCKTCAFTICRQTGENRVTTKEIFLRERWYKIAVRPLINASGECISALHIVTDITASKDFDMFFSEKFKEAGFSAAFRISTIYALLGVLWIALSDSFFAYLLDDTSSFALAAVIKGSVFVLVTATMLFFILYKSFKNIQYKEIDLAKSEKKYHSIVELSPDAIIAYKRGVITYVNTRGIQLFGGITANDLIGSKVSKYILSSSSNIIELINKPLDHDNNSSDFVDCKIKNLHGDTFEAEISYCTFNNGIEMYTQFVIRDVTERNEVQNKLKESERIFRAMIENMKLVAITLDVNGNIIFCNDYFSNLVAMPKHSIMFNNFFDTFINLSIKEELKEQFNDSILAESFPIHSKSTIITNKGAGRIIYWNNTLMHDSNNNINGLTCIGEDITDRFVLESTLKMKNLELIEAYDITLQGWSKALDLRDHETDGHSQRVTEGSVELAMLFDLSADELLDVKRGALLHDIGKIGVPDRILLKPGKLDKEEEQVMRNHPNLSFELLSPIPFLGCALHIPYCHHERWDGTGYPRGISGNEIPLIARIFSIVDVYDALASNRPYRPAWPEEKITAYLLAESGKMFDPKVVEVFLKYKGVPANETISSSY